MGLHIQMDQRVLDGTDWRRRLSPILSFALYRVAQSTASQNGRSVTQLRRYSYKFSRQPRHQATSYKSLPEKTVQEHQPVCEQQVS